MFYGDAAANIIGKDIMLLLAQTRGRADFVPPAIDAAVGKKSTVLAMVKDETYDAEEEGLIVFEVKKAEVINQSAPIEPSITQENTSTPKDALTFTSSCPDMQQPLQNIAHIETTPAKDTHDGTCSHIDELLYSYRHCLISSHTNNATLQDPFSNTENRKTKAESIATSETKKKSTSSSKNKSAQKGLTFSSDE